MVLTHFARSIVFNTLVNGLCSRYRFGHTVLHSCTTIHRTLILLLWLVTHTYLIHFVCTCLSVRYGPKEMPRREDIQLEVLTISYSSVCIHVSVHACIMKSLW